MAVSSTNAIFGPKVSLGASNFCVDNGRLSDVAEDCLSAEEVERPFWAILSNSWNFFNYLPLYLSD